MFHLDWLKVGGATRGTPRWGPTRRARWVALGLIASLVLVDAGCQSGSGGHCNLFSPCGFLGRTTSRVFNRNRNNGGCCESGVVTDAPVEYGAPPAGVVVPAPAPAPLYGPGIGSGTAPSTVPPAPAGELEPIPSARPGASTPSPGAGSANPRTGFYTGPAGARLAARRAPTLARSPNLSAAPEPTRRPAQERSSSAVDDARRSEDPDPLDHLPPLDLPSEVTHSANTPPTPPAADPEAKRPKESPKPAVSLRQDASVADPVRLTAAAEPAPESASTGGAGPGIAKFAAVDLKLAGGSAPSGEGLSWLAENGYRTLLDLRESSEVTPSFIADASKRGLRYVALPISLKAIDRDQINRFNYEITAGEARPLFFFDTDGSRAGALWYIRRRTVDQVDDPIARREGELLGLSGPTAWLTATDCLAKLSGVPTSAPASRPRSGDASSPPPATPRPGEPAANPPAAAEAPPRNPDPPQPAATAQPTPVTAAAARLEAKTANLAPASSSSSVTTDGSTHAEPTSARSLDPMTWRPIAAMLLTGLSLPLAYWTRTLVPTVLAKARASLPGPGPRPRSLPDESGA